MGLFIINVPGCSCTQVVYTLFAARKFTAQSEGDLNGNKCNCSISELNLFVQCINKDISDTKREDPQIYQQKMRFRESAVGVKGGGLVMYNNYLSP